MQAWWTLILVVCVVVVLITGKKDDRVISPLSQLFFYPKSFDQCGGSLNKYTDDTCTDDPSSNSLSNDKLNFLYDVEKSDYGTEEFQKSDYIKSLSNDVEEFEKRGGYNMQTNCNCQAKVDVLDLGPSHYPRYLLYTICHNDENKPNALRKCSRGTHCKAIEYKVRVLTYRTPADILEKDQGISLLPEVLRPYWKFKVVSVATGCFCSF